MSLTERISGSRVEDTVGRVCDRQAQIRRRNECETALAQAIDESFEMFDQIEALAVPQEHDHAAMSIEVIDIRVDI